MSFDTDTVNKLREIIRLHDVAFDHAMLEDSHHKSSEGYVEIRLTNRFDPERIMDPLHIKGIGIYSYVLGPSRMHDFDSVDKALMVMQGWHDTEMRDI